MGYIYYSKHNRSIAPGTFPKPEGNKILQVKDFERAIYIVGIGEVYGGIEYEHPLSDEDWEGYELIPGDHKYWYGARYRTNNDGTGHGRMLKPVLAKDMPSGRSKITERYTITERWFERRRDAERFCETGEA